MLVSKTLYDLFVSFTARKIKVDDLIKLMNMKLFEVSTSQAKGQDVGNDDRNNVEKDVSEKMWKLVMMKKSMNMSPLVTSSNDVVFTDVFLVFD